jgi:hypothetical protein
MKYVIFALTAVSMLIGVSFGDAYYSQVERDYYRRATYSRYVVPQYIESPNWYINSVREKRTYSKEYYLSGKQYTRNIYEKRKGDNRWLERSNGRTYNK